MSLVDEAKAKLELEGSKARLDAVKAEWIQGLVDNLHDELIDAFTEAGVPKETITTQQFGKARKEVIQDYWSVSFTYVPNVRYGQTTRYSWSLRENDERGYNGNIPWTLSTIQTCRMAATDMVFKHLKKEAGKQWPPSDIEGEAANG